jgi:hypothetical protein
MKNCRQWKQRSLKLQDFFEWKSIPTRNIQVEDRADRPMRTSHGAELICGARNMPFSVKSIQLSNWILWQFSNGWCGIFITRRKILENIGSEADFDLVDKAWSETGKWAEKVAQFRHPKIQAIRLAGDPNAPVLPEKMTLDELRESIMADLERLRDTGALDLPRLLQGVVANPNVNLPTNGGGQAEQWSPPLFLERANVHHELVVYQSAADQISRVPVFALLHRPVFDRLVDWLGFIVAARTCWRAPRYFWTRATNAQGSADDQADWLS